MAVLRLVLTAAALFGVELLWSGTASASEAATAAGLAIALTGWAALLRRVSHRQYRFPRGAWRPIARAAADLPGATWRTVVALCRQPVPVHADEIAFRHGAEDDPKERARRAAALIGASLTPESFLIRGDQGRAASLVHRIGDRPVRGDPEWLA